MCNDEDDLLSGFLPNKRKMETCEKQWVFAEHIEAVILIYIY